MREVTKRLVIDFKLMELGYDFMGYLVCNKGELSFHHMVVPRRESRKRGLGNGYVYWNGSILVQRTSHDYLHTVEHYDFDRYLYVNGILIDIHDLGSIGLDNLRKIRDCLVGFEREYSGVKGKKGNEIIKDCFIDERVLTKKL